MRVALHWLRRDLRIDDNTALAEATRAAGAVIPVYVVNPRILRAKWIAPARVAGLAGGLADLARRLEGAGGRLVVRVGDDNAEELARLAAEFGAEAVYANRGIGRFDARLEREIAARLAADGRQFLLSDDVGVLPPDAVRTQTGAPFTVYTPFARRWRETLFAAPPAERSPQVAALRAGGELAREAASVDAEAAFRAAGVDLAPWMSAYGGGRTAALTRLERFVAERIGDYREERNFPAEPGTSRLSPALRWGLISYREAFRAARAAQAKSQDAEARASIDAWLGEIAWADFYRAVLQHFPYSQDSAFKPAYDRLAFPGEPSHLDAWKAGRTGYPMVDAGMRQLLAEGWMHNRLRLIVASFLVKDVLIDWREGVLHFMQHLACGDTSANVGGWQWAASTGTDAQPYFRIFNPVTQSEKFDPQGVYIRRYVPELAQMPTRYIHAPWLAPSDEQQRAGCVIGNDYPAPIVDHATQRARVLALYRTVDPAAANAQK